MYHSTTIITLELIYLNMYKLFILQNISSILNDIHEYKF